MGYDDLLHSYEAFTNVIPISNKIYKKNAFQLYNFDKAPGVLNH